MDRVQEIIEESVRHETRLTEAAYKQGKRIFEAAISSYFEDLIEVADVVALVNSKPVLNYLPVEGRSKVKAALGAVSWSRVINEQRSLVDHSLGEWWRDAGEPAVGLEAASATRLMADLISVDTENRNDEMAEGFDDWVYRTLSRFAEGVGTDLEALLEGEEHDPTQDGGDEPDETERWRQLAREALQLNSTRSVSPTLLAIFTLSAALLWGEG